MKRSAILASLIFICLGATATAYGQNTYSQKTCEFNIAGTWQASSPQEKNPTLYHFTSDGTVTALSRPGSDPAAEPQVVGSATYKLDDAKAPKSIAFKAIDEGGSFAYGAKSMEIIEYDDASFTCRLPGSEPSRWTRVDTGRYFIVLAARNGAFYDSSGPAFSMLVKIDGREIQVDAVGTYSVKGKRAFGTVPPEAYGEFMKGSQSDSEVNLRLEINRGQYERGLKILRTWERRVREDALLYARTSYLNNVLLVKEVAESLNRCSERIKLYKLNYLIDEDWITENHGSPFVPFQYFKELRRLNESLHVRDEEFSKLATQNAGGHMH